MSRFLPVFFCCEERIDPCFFLSVTYFCHFLGPFFQVCGSEDDSVLFAEELFFRGHGFLVEMSGNVDEEPPYSSCDLC